MKVITIKQPYASLIVSGYKEYEFRTWKTNYRGKLLIQASKSVDKKAMKKFERYNLDYPIGCIIGICDLVDCIKIDDDVRCMLLKKNDVVYHNIATDKSFNGYGFKLENIKKLDPIYVSGALGLWNYDYEV